MNAMRSGGHVAWNKSVEQARTWNKLRSDRGVVTRERERERERQRAVVSVPLHFSREVTCSTMSMTESAKRQRLLDAGGPIEDDETARQKMRDANVSVIESGEEIFGFDPDNVMDVKEQGPLSIPLTPMSYFCGDSDLPMMRWLFVNGADVTPHNNEMLNPMTIAAVNGREEEVKWLFLRGAADDLLSGATKKPFHHLFAKEEHRKLVVWLMLSGAFCRSNDNKPGLPVLDIEKMKASLSRRVPYRWSRVGFSNARRHLLEWAAERHEARTSFLTFLNGTYSRQKGQISPFLVSLNGKPGILELIADYSGPPLGREARVVRQLVDLLPGIYIELEDEEDRWAQP